MAVVRGLLGPGLWFPHRRAGAHRFVRHEINPADATERLHGEQIDLSVPFCVCVATRGGCCMTRVAPHEARRAGEGMLFAALAPLGAACGCVRFVQSIHAIGAQVLMVMHGRWGHWPMW